MRMVRKEIMRWVLISQKMPGMLQQNRPMDEPPALQLL
ncbi:hypothetical protein TevJSym_ac00280 [endosymbiont of Tevnia jerichonana (vent Tica)]|uniref:Uncharacterized protein n=1 Tax=endosymbiont of Tevnia jerichonana (vent Tica) TaxID=1049564 RepID=G2FCA2_9GAMM|nr:hypothetical protein TevJSym_ac00280 [endosymbiont of Tevnia jerichonana (vent Tica)]